MSNRKIAAAATAACGRWDIPVGWKWQRATEFARVVGGSTPANASDTSNYDERGVPGRTPADLSNYRRAEIGAGRRSLARHLVREDSLLPAGTVLISSRAPVGYCAIAANPVVTNQGFRSLVLNNSVDPYFLRHYILHSRSYLESRASGTTFKELSGGALGELLFPIPPLDVQKGIVAYIDQLFAEVDDGEAALARARADLEVYRRALLKAAVTGELTADWRAANPAGETGAELLARILADRRVRWHADPKNKGKRYDEPIGPNTATCDALPTGWVWASLGQLSWASSYGTSAKCDYEGKGNIVLRIPNIKQGRIDLADTKRSFSPLDVAPNEALQPSDLLIIRTNGSADLIGRVGLVVEALSSELVYFASYLIRFRLVPGGYLIRWLSIVSNGPYFRALVLQAIGSSAGQYNLSMTKLECFPIPLPPPHELLHIADECERLLSAESEMGFQIDELTAAQAILRQSILAAAFRGALT